MVDPIDPIQVPPAELKFAPLISRDEVACVEISATYMVTYRIMIIGIISDISEPIRNHSESMNK